MAPPTRYLEHLRTSGRESDEDPGGGDPSRCGECDKAGAAAWQDRAKPPARPNRVWVDNIVVATEYIGPVQEKAAN